MTKPAPAEIPAKVRVKSVEWAFPSSDKARRFGYNRRGCWCLEVGNAGEPLVAITAHNSRESAMAHARSLSLREWDVAFRAEHPEECGGAP